MAKKTALFEEHLALNAKMVEFAGWQLPISYTGLLDEHQSCRNKAGLFDVSHMGEFLIEGPEAGSFLDFLVTNQPSAVVDGQAQYTVMCQEDGGIVDDLIIYKFNSEKFIAVVNAANIDKDFSWFNSVHQKKSFNCRLKNMSDHYSQIAIQGPLAQEILQKITHTPLAPIKGYHFAEGFLLKDQIPALIARTGYTGEDGFELYVPWSSGALVWRALLEAGTPLGLKPCGLGARDTLRLEMKYPLYGNELSEKTHPLEAGLSWVTKLQKPDFVGRAALCEKKEHGIKRALVGFTVLERGIPRHGYPLFVPHQQEPIGIVTSGTHSPSMNKPIGVGYVPIEFSKVGSSLEVEIRGIRFKAEVVPTPFYKKG